MQRKFRLTKSSDFQRVRHTGKSYAHPLIVLIVSAAPAQPNLYGIAAGRAVGPAVQRNQVKRWLREALRPLLPQISPGWRLVFLARRPSAQANFAQIRQAMLQLLQRAGLLLPIETDHAH